ncbi:MAG: ROK family protein [Gammaproteobacteria bacterium]
MSKVTESSFRMGIDLGGTKTEVLVLDPAGEPVYRRRVDTPAHGYTQILAMVGELVADAEHETGHAVSVGIGIPGAISAVSGRLRNSNTLCLNGSAFDRDLETALGRPVRIENDANCFALSEALGGAARGHAVVFGAIVGTGTGGGIVVDGRLLRGAHAIGGEWGHNPLPWRRAEDGEPACYCGKTACIETFLSGPGMARNYAARHGRAMTSREIVAAAASGEPSCVQMLDLYHDQMARALAHLINILDPGAVVLGGGMSNIESIYLELPRRLPEYVFSDFVATPILRAEHGDASGVYGAAMLWE